jgi:acetyl-CoA carboxylase biotin carboxyl carrier protein
MGGLWAALAAIIALVNPHEPEEGLSQAGMGPFAIGPALTPEAIDEVAGLIDEFGLERIEVTYPTFRLAFGPRPSLVPSVAPVSASVEYDEVEDSEPEPANSIPASVGIPISSPMTGIYYGRSNPASPPFVSEGALVTAGQVVCLIEAMKVFNEIVAPASGTVGRIGPRDGDIVQPGDVLLTVLP